MAWTTPRTWTTGEVVTASHLNAHVRDNFNAFSTHTHSGVAGDGSNLAGRLVVVKAADQSVTNSTTLVNDTHLIVPVAANEAWIVRYYLFITSPQESDFKAALDVPAAAGKLNFGIFGFTSATSGAASTTPWTETDAATVILNWGTTTAPGPAAVFAAYFLNGSNAGNIQLQWAQQAANISPTTVELGSFLIAQRIA